jgi:hypothetical protein
MSSWPVVKALDDLDGVGLLDPTQKRKLVKLRDRPRRKASLAAAAGGSAERVAAPRVGRPALADLLARDVLGQPDGQPVVLGAEPLGDGEWGDPGGFGVRAGPARA